MSAHEFPVPISCSRILSPVTIRIPGVYDNRPNTTVERAVLDVFGVPREHTFGRTRTAPAVDARFALYLLLREKEGWSLKQIGQFVGRHHSAVLYGIKRARMLQECYGKYRDKMDAARKILGI